MSLVFETVITRTATVVSVVWDAAASAVAVTLSLEGQTLKIAVHPETGARFYPGRLVTLKLSI